MSKIEWTEKTWNPIVGCSIVSPGCKHCYAMIMAHRLAAMGVKHYAGLTEVVNGHVVWTGKMARAPDKILTEPLRRTKPTTYFVNSMGDLFHESIPDAWIDEVFAVMALAQTHTFQVLTKRSARMREYFERIEGAGVRMNASLRKRFGLKYRLSEWQWPLPNVWIGVSAERQSEANLRIPDLLQTPAAVRFVSAEPLLGPINLQEACIYFIERGEPEPLTRKIDWLICGGESGPGSRPMHPDWARGLRDECVASEVAFFFKQQGEWSWGGFTPKPGSCGPAQAGWVRLDGRWATSADDRAHEVCDGQPIVRVGKKRAGRLLDGRTWDEMPSGRRKAAA